MDLICVCGAGTMGSGIAQVAATAGFDTLLYDSNPAMLDKARAAIEKNLEVLVGKGRIRMEDKTTIVSRLKFTSGIQDCKADLIIEAIAEIPEVKVSLFNQLAALNSKECIFASNTSSLSLNDIAAKVHNPERLIGMHFFNPAPIMKLVEVVTTDYTDPNITSAVLDLSTLLGKTPVVCNDSPGFIVNRVARPYYIESLRLVEDGYGSFESLDGLLEATGFKMGPFRLMDLIGNDINYAVSSSVYELSGRPERLKPSVIQEQKVAAGELGRKAGKGYYRYN